MHISSADCLSALASGSVPEKVPRHFNPWILKSSDVDLHLSLIVDHVGRSCSSEKFATVYAKQPGQGPGELNADGMSKLRTSKVTRIKGFRLKLAQFALNDVVSVNSGFHEKCLPFREMIRRCLVFPFPARAHVLPEYPRIQRLRSPKPLKVSKVLIRVCSFSCGLKSDRPKAPCPKHHARSRTSIGFPDERSSKSHKAVL